MEEDPLLTPRTGPYGGVIGMRRRRPGSLWKPGAVLLGVVAVAVPVLVFALSRL